jgi:hypothetical protein
VVAPWLAQVYTFAHYFYQGFTFQFVIITLVHGRADQLYMFFEPLHVPPILILCEIT